MIFLQRSEFIVKNLAEIENSLEFARFKFKDVMGTTEYTKAYGIYNLFALLHSDALFYQIFIDLRERVRTALKLEPNQPLWMQAWMNADRPEGVLDWHDHEWPWHGYISIDPKNTNTVFEDGVVKNVPGQIYFGDGNNRHKVEVLEPYEGLRTTIGFDVTNVVGERTRYVSFIPF